MAAGFLRRWQDAWRFANSADSLDILRILRGTANAKSGAVVNHRTALQATTSLACARVIAEGIAQVPFKHMKYDGTNRIPLTGSSLYRVLHDAPNEWMSAYDFREMMGIHLVFAGGFYAFINRVRGEVVELLPFEPGDVTVKRDGWKLSYEVRMKDGGKPQQIPAANMWHIRGPSWNGWMGLDGVKMVREAIGLALATEEHGAIVFKNGGQTTGILSTDQQLSPQKAKELRESWQEHQAGDNRFKIAVLWGGMTHTSTANTNEQTQFLQTRGFQVEEICRGFRVLPIMVGHSDKAQTYATAEQMFIAHVTFTLMPWGVRIEKSANLNLLNEKQRKAGEYTHFMFNGLLRGASKDRSEFYAKALGSGGSPAWMTQDEVRDLEEMNPFGGNAALLREPSNAGDTIPSEQEGDDGNAN